MQKRKKQKSPGRDQKAPFGTERACCTSATKYCNAARHRNASSSPLPSPFKTTYYCSTNGAQKNLLLKQRSHRRLVATNAGNPVRGPLLLQRRTCTSSRVVYRDDDGSCLPACLASISIKREVPAINVRVLADHERERMER